VRLRHTLVNERGEWQQRMQAVLYHHGLPGAASCWGTRSEKEGARVSYEAEVGEKGSQGRQRPADL